jgi:hypothetical protein
MLSQEEKEIYGTEQKEKIMTLSSASAISKGQFRVRWYATKRSVKRGKNTLSPLIVEEIVYVFK